MNEVFYLLWFLLGIYKISLLIVCSYILSGCKAPFGNSKLGWGIIFKLLIIEWDDSSPTVSWLDAFNLEVD